MTPFDNQRDADRDDALPPLQLQLPFRRNAFPPGNSVQPTIFEFDRGRTEVPSRALLLAEQLLLHASVWELRLRKERSAWSTVQFVTLESL